MKKLMLLLPLLLMFLSYCEEDNPALPVNSVPDLSDIQAPTTLYTVSSEIHFISVVVTDAQGVADITSVICSVTVVGSDAVIKTMALFDDKTHGDVIPLNGQFTTGITADSLENTAGSYELTFLATDQAGNTSDPLSAEIEIIDGEENVAPVISDVQTPTSISIQDTTAILITAKVTDKQGAEDIESVVLNVHNQNRATAVSRLKLTDDGEEGDSVAGDSIFSVLITGAVARNQIGIFTFHFQAFDKQGAASDPLTRNVRMLAENNASPVISNLVAPDTMYLDQSSAISTVLQLTVTDEQGLTDIRSVYFNSFRPGNIPATGNPFKMADDGRVDANGDEAADDGVYSLRIYLPPDTQPGKYRFEFEAIDFSDEKSNLIIHELIVAQ